MDSSSNTHNLGQDDENLRVKFLCSFSGSVMPRPQDGKLRYVGGETRMVSVCRFIKYEEIMEKMREIYEPASILKYQQPEEDLDALVSVVNDDDVMNMMEENDKLLDFGDGFTRLRIFLFANPEMDSSPHLEIEAHESGISRYVDALNNIPDSCDNNLIESQGNPDLLLQHQFNLRHLAVPRLDQRYSEVEGVRSPIYCSPSYHHHDMHSDSPSSAIFRSKISDEYSHQPITPPRVSDNLVWFPPGDRSCFPLNLNNHGSCENCRMNMQRNMVFSDEHPYFQQHHCFKNGGFQACSSDNSPSNREISSDKSYMKGICGPVNNEAHFVDKSWKGGYNMMNFSNYNHYHHDFLHEQSGAGRSFSPLSNEEENATFFNNFPHTCRVDTTNQASYRSHLYPTGGGATSPRVIRGTPESSPRFCIGKDGQNVGFDGYMIPVEYSVFAHESQHIVTTTDERETHCFIPSMPMASPSTPRGFKADVTSSCIIDSEVMDSDACVHDENSENVNKNHEMKSRNEKSMENDSESWSSTFPKHVDVYPLSSVGDFGDGRRSIHEVPESVKEMSLRDRQEQKIEVHNGVSSPLDVAREDVLVGVETISGIEDKDVESRSEQSNMSKIEPTKAEEEALARGLQTIKNDDLEEIRELGSGTYGAVYHGKWKGSDVAVKRIKATCFSGKPSERERMITDFWKEASILSSLHHPNVVSFYGIVRDGPDGSLATVTEFMINGSLKQFLHKKDRTVDRRKRLIIGMDVAFGMEYLHGKNIVHFDLKCENLLVNMRDPHRPICKIGDLGLSKVKRNTLVSGGVRGTLPWMAPELLSGKNSMVTEKIDVYSFGIVMWELLTGEDPYSEMHCASIIGGIVNNELRPEIPTWCDPEWKCLMESCWASDPSQRPSFSLISHKLRTMGAAINLK